MDLANPNTGGVINPPPVPQTDEITPPTLASSDPPSTPLTDPVGAPPSSFPPSSSGAEVVPPAVPPSDPLSTGEPLVTPPTGPSPRGKKVVLSAIAGILLLGTIGGGIYIATHIAPNPADQTGQATSPSATPAPQITGVEVTYLGGTAWSISGDAKVPLTQGQSVVEGATIETEDDAKMLLTLGEGSIVRIGPSSKITLTSLDPESMNFTQEQGIIYAYVGSESVATFTVVAGDVTIEAQGTAFSVEKDELAFINVFDNKVMVRQGGKEKEVAENTNYVQGAEEAFDLNTDELETDSFLQWALEEELGRIEAEIASEAEGSASLEAKEAYKTTLEALGIEKLDVLKDTFLASTTGAVSKITLTGSRLENGAVSLSWTSDGLAENGYKIVWSTTLGKPYPADKRTSEPILGYAKTLGPMKPGKTWYYRVCEWTGETCGIYSNELSFSF